MLRRASSRRVSTCAAALPPLIAAFGIFTDYIAGRLFSIPIGNFAPAVDLALGAMILSWAAALILIGVSFAYRTSPFRKTAVLLSSVAVTALALACALHTRPYLLGVRDSVFSAGTADEFRAAAVVIRELLPLADSPLDRRSSLAGPGKWSIWDEQRDRSRWAEATRRAPCIGRLDSSVWIFRHGDRVTFTWGGALVGHSGFRIGHNLRDGNEREILPYADDMMFFYGE
jgi:hypothetical protein